MDADFLATVGRLDVCQDFVELAKKVFDSCQGCIKDACTGGHSSQVGMCPLCTAGLWARRLVRHCSQRLLSGCCNSLYLPALSPFKCPGLGWMLDC